MAPTSSLRSVNYIASRADGDSNFQSTPVEAVVVPIVVLVLLLLGAALVSLYKYWQRRNDTDRLIKAATPKLARKLIPAWLSNWLGSSTSKSSKTHNTNLGVRSKSTDSESDLPKPQPASLLDENSDAIALRPVSVQLPPHALTAYDPYDRYPGVRPKPIGVQFG